MCASDRSAHSRCRRMEQQARKKACAKRIACAFTPGRAHDRTREKKCLFMLLVYRTHGCERSLRAGRQPRWPDARIATQRADRRCTCFHARACARSHRENERMHFYLISGPDARARALPAGWQAAALGGWTRCNPASRPTDPGRQVRKNGRTTLALLYS